MQNLVKATFGVKATVAVLLAIIMLAPGRSVIGFAL